MLGKVINLSYANKGLQIETNYKDEIKQNWYSVPDKFAEMFQDIKKGDEVDFKYETSGNNKILIDLTLKKFNSPKENNEYQKKEDTRSRSIILQAFGKIAAQLVLSSASSRSVEDTKTAYSDYMDYIEEDYKKRLGE